MDANRQVLNEQVLAHPLDVVVIDDEELFTEGCRQTLELGGYKAAVARGGLEGLQLVQAARPGVVLVDLKMPGMDGIETLNAIKNSDRNQPVVLCSAYGEFKQDFSSWVSDGYVVKSADMGELKQTIRRVLILS